MFERWMKSCDEFLDKLTNWLWDLFERDMRTAEAIIRFFDNSK